MQVTRRYACAAILLAVLTAGCGKPKAAQLTDTEVKEFFTAVEDGDAAIVERLIKAKPALVNARNENGQTPLQVATQRNNEEVADVLRKNGAAQ